jgi:Tfp pilus assembly protein PilO
MNSKSFYIWFGLPVLVIAAWVFLAYIPMHSAMQTREGTLTVVKNERQKLDASIMNLASEARTQKQLQQAYNEFMNQAPVMEKMPEYVRNVMKMAQDKGVAVKSLHGYYNTLELSQKAGLANPEFEVELKGGFLEMGRFLEELSGKAGFSAIHAARIGYDDKEYPTLTGKFVIEFKALKGKKNESK